MAEAPENEEAICWDLSWQDEYGYRKLYLSVFVSEVVSVQGLIDQADSGSGWSRPEVSARMSSFYRRVLGAGHEAVYDRPSSFLHPKSFRLSWTEYTPDSSMDPRGKGYTRHKIVQLGDDSYEGAVKGMNLLGSILTKIKKLFPDLRGGNPCLDDPRFILYTLERTKGAVRVRRFDRSVDEPYTLVADETPRVRLRSEGVLSMFGY